MDLPLSLVTDPELNATGLQDIAKYVKDHLATLGQFISRRRGLQSVSIVDISLKDGLLYLTFGIKDEAQLEELYQCLKTQGNELSKCISRYLLEKSLELKASLRLKSDITCDIWMSKKSFHEWSLTLIKTEDKCR